jgi:gamma-glutamyl-gamma-aminobutyrate hydrolase PuuD
VANATNIDGTVGAKPRIAIPEPCSYDAEYSGRALPPYLCAIEAAGGEPVVIPLQSSPEEIARIITSCAAILLPGSKADVDPQKFNAAAHPKTAPADPPRDASRYSAFVMDCSRSTFGARVRWCNILSPR